MVGRQLHVQLVVICKSEENCDAIPQYKKLRVMIQVMNKNDG